MSPGTTELGIIADTHGLLRPEAIAALAGVLAILHAGDVGGPEILTALAAVAPVHAVRGNTDRGPWGDSLPLSLPLEFTGERLLLRHGHLVHAPTQEEAQARVIISGHTHVPKVEWRRGVLHLNPGSAGPRRLGLPVTLARLRLHSHGAHEVRIIELV